MQKVEGSVTGHTDRVYVKANLTCLSPIEIPYYLAKYEDIRYHCGTTDELVISGNNYLICSSCIQEKQCYCISMRKKLLSKGIRDVGCYVKRAFVLSLCM